MSLLLEALKKAELAKQGAKPPQEDAPRGTAREPESPLPVMTREKLPDISQPLEILSEDLPSARVQRPPLELATAAPEPVRESATPAAAMPVPEAPARPAPAAETGGRQAARQLFEAKEMEYNPKRPFYITMGALGLAAAGYGGYLWWQLQPKYSVNTAAVQGAKKSGAPESQSQAPPGSAAETAQAPASGPAQASGPAAAAPATAAPVAAPVASAPAPPAADSKAEPPAPAAKAPVFVRGGRPATTAAAAASAAAAQRAGPGAASAPAQRAPSRASRPTVTVSPPEVRIDPVIERAYQAFQRGEFAAARTDYQWVLQREPASRDALLGLAAIDVRTREFATAEVRYEKLLELDPRDTFAQAGLIALRRQVDPVQMESRIKTLIAANPEATHLYFHLGNQYAQQSRWSEAQSAYFRAYIADPDNPDYAYNLGVSLDHLRQRRQALEYYERSLTLAQKRPGSFDRGQAQGRIQELKRD